MDNESIDQLSLADRWDEGLMSKEYLKFGRIPKGDRLHPSNVLCAYLKIASLMRKPEDFEAYGEHDIIYLADEAELGPITDEDIVYLMRCGIHWDTECNRLANFC